MSSQQVHWITHHLLKAWLKCIIVSFRIGDCTSRDSSGLLPLPQTPFLLLLLLLLLSMTLKGYREIMTHWDEVLPGRIVHINYEDLVRDTATLTKAIIGSTGLDWHDEILDFHKKKQAVNTLSTTQVRKGIYSDSLQSWRKYEQHLQPLVGLIGKHVVYPLETTVPGYSSEKHIEDQVI